jgi:hypothetical protein
MSSERRFPALNLNKFKMSAKTWVESGDSVASTRQLENRQQIDRSGC